MPRLLPLLLVALLALAGLTGAAPQTTLPDVEDEVMCTTCGVALNIAESPQADRQRAFIRTLVDRGMTKDEVKASLVDEYGPDVLAMPQDEGVGLAAYLVPVAAALAVLAMLAVLLPRWRRRPPGPPPAGPAGTPGGVTEDELARLDREVRAG
jgi:cytochrome c-type biogenesis protein CcmH/NrfF